jgi:hypothetical protein
MKATGLQKAALALATATVAAFLALPALAASYDQSFAPNGYSGGINQVLEGTGLSLTLTDVSAFTMLISTNGSYCLAATVNADLILNGSEHHTVSAALPAYAYSGPVTFFFSEVATGAFTSLDLTSTGCTGGQKPQYYGGAFNSASGKLSGYLFAGSWYQSINPYISFSDDPVYISDTMFTDTGGADFGDEICADANPFADPDFSGDWSILNFFGAFIPSVQQSLYGFFFYNCQTLQPLVDIKNTLSAHAPFRQGIWLTQTIFDAIRTQQAPEDMVLRVPFEMFGPGQEVVIFDPGAVYSFLGGDEGWGTYGIPVVIAGYYLALAFFFYEEMKNIFKL